jgi:hypothetical protein
MTLALFCTMFAAVLFQPVLMGPPRKVEPHAGEVTGNQAQVSTLRP